MRVALLVAGAALAMVATLGTLRATGTLAFQETRQEEIAEKGARVMPFDLEAIEAGPRR